MISISAAFRKYNANSKNNNVGDCVKRSLAYAYGMDYNEVSRELNRIKSAGSAYNNLSTFSKFLKNHGAIYMKDDNYHYRDLTEAEFADKFNDGIYVLLTGPENKSYSTHLVCIFKGDIVDSWNSSNYKVFDAWKVEGVHDQVSDVTWDDIADEMNAFADNYVESINKKYHEWFVVEHLPQGYQPDDLTYKMKFKLTTGDLPDESEYFPHRSYVRSIVVKLNPRMNTEENLAALKPKLKQSIYDWVYPYQKDMRDTKAIANIQNEHYKYNRDKKALLKLPEWVRPLVTYFYYDESGRWSYNKYELRFKALPDDPYIEERGDRVSIDTDSYKELKDALADYKDHYAREGYDY